MPGADAHQRGRLVQRHVLCQQAVENLESRLFFGSQRHILHGVECDIYAGQLATTFLLNVNKSGRRRLVYHQGSLASLNVRRLIVQEECPSDGCSEEPLAGETGRLC